MILASLALVFASSPAPAAGEAHDADALACAASEQHAELRSQMADSLMEVPPSPTNELREAFVAAMEPCLEAQSVSEDARPHVLRAGLAVMLLAEFEARIRATGFDFAQVEALQAARRADPGFDLYSYVEARPEIYDARVTAIEKANGMKPGTILDLVGTYLGVADEFDRSQAALGAL